MSNLRRVLHIAPTPFFSDRGCHIRIRNEIETLKNAGWEVVLCSYGHGLSDGGLAVKRTPKIKGFDSVKAGFSPYRILADWLLFILVLKVIFKTKINIIHAHLHEGIWMAFFVKVLLFWRPIKLVFDIQGSLTGELLSYGSIKKGLLYYLIKTMEYTSYRLTTNNLCSSTQSRQMLISDFGVHQDRLTLLHDFIAVSFFKNLKKNLDLNLPSNKTIIVYSGSLLEGKGLRVLMEVIKDLSHRVDIHFLIIGYPEKQMKCFIKDKQLNEFVTLTGRVSFDQLNGFLSQAHVAIDPKEPGSGEASGKMIYYMASNLPVVCFDSPSNRDLLSKGYFSKEVNSKSFHNELVKAIENVPERSSIIKANTDYVRENYNAQRALEILEDIYLN